MAVENKHLRHLIDDLQRELSYQRRDIEAQRDFYNMLKARGPGPIAPMERFIRECDENANRLEMRVDELCKLLPVRA